MLDRPRLLRLSAAPAPGSAAAVAAAALAAQAAGDPTAPALVRRLGEAGVVAVTAGRRGWLCRETVTGWLLLPTTRRLDAVALATAARARAFQLATIRTLQPGPHPGPSPARPPATPPASGPAAVPPMRPTDSWSLAAVPRTRL